MPTEPTSTRLRGFLRKPTPEQVTELGLGRLYPDRPVVEDRRNDISEPYLQETNRQMRSALAALPGQAASYYLGYQSILALREEARAALGERFDLQAFHDAVLRHGSLPLPLLERTVRAELGVEGGGG